ncbi:hypothetical protein MmiHf6_01590 [Methanimicrococcus hongohii]|uniref:Imm-5-like domain-containing protein n=2 Tax=Methanimicrococcus hongohii TaxID=3028295 RepID=A0AA96UYB1_9EURY|nr:hypothetical protein MmiHf6_01590 [Methanimicrococcus sp. Hf6]
MYPIEQILNEADQKTKAKWALDCAEHVLFYFNNEFPDDSRPSNAIAAGRSWLNDEIKVLDARNASVAAHNAARDVVETDFSSKTLDPLSEGEGLQAAACAAARSAGQAVAVAHAAGHAQHAADYAIKAVSYGEGTDEAVRKEREWQYNRLLEITGKS